MSVEEKEHAAYIQQTLQWVKQQIQQNRTDYRNLEQEAAEKLDHNGFKTDYFNIARQDDLEPAQADDRQLVILAAAFMGKVRLIDNIQIK